MREASEAVSRARRSSACGGSGNLTHLSRVVEVVGRRIGRESVAKVGRSPPSSAKMLSLVFGQRFRNQKRLDPRPDQVVSLWLERVGLGIPSLPLAIDDDHLASTPEKQERMCELQRGNRGGASVYLFDAQH